MVRSGSDRCRNRANLASGFFDRIRLLTKYIRLEPSKGSDSKSINVCNSLGRAISEIAAMTPSTAWQSNA